MTWLREPRFSCLLTILGALLIICFVNSDNAYAHHEYGYVSEWGGLGNGPGEFVAPWGVAVSPTGFVYVTDKENHNVQKFDLEGNFITSWGNAGSGPGDFDSPMGIATSNAYVYVADTSNRRIQKFDKDGGFIKQWQAGGPGDPTEFFPRGVTLDDSGKVYVTDWALGRIQKFNSNGDFIAQWGSKGSADGELIEPTGIVVDYDNNVFVSDWGNNRIQKFDTSGNFILKWGYLGEDTWNFSNPSGITIGPTGDVFVADAHHANIDRFDQVGNYISSSGRAGSGPGEFSHQIGEVDFDELGYLYVADRYNHKVQKLYIANHETSSSTTVPQDLNQPTSRNEIRDDLDVGSLPIEAFRNACGLRITSPKVKTRKLKTTKVSSKTVRRLFTHGAKGYIKWGQVEGRDVKCEKIKMLLLQKRGKRYYIPGTNYKVSKKRLTVKNFNKKAVRYIRKKKKVGKLRVKHVTSKRRTKFSFKDFNRKSKVGKRALNKLRKKKYRGTFVFIYTAEVGGRTVMKRVALRVKKAS